VLTGLTGAGKTDFLASQPAWAVRPGTGNRRARPRGHARHRGSAFGAEDAPQPAQATFENAVAAACG
jgi:tRNA 2-selenouridine synthase SelU